MKGAGSRGMPAGGTSTSWAVEIARQQRERRNEVAAEAAAREAAAARLRDVFTGAIDAWWACFAATCRAAINAYAEVRGADVILRVRTEQHPDLRTFSVRDERSGGFALITVDEEALTLDIARQAPGRREFEPQSFTLAGDALAVRAAGMDMTADEAARHVLAPWFAQLT